MADEEIPPLDDMTDLLQQVEALRETPMTRLSQATRGQTTNSASKNFNNCQTSKNHHRQADLGDLSPLGAAGYTHPPHPSHQTNAPVNNLTASASGSRPKPMNCFAGLKSGFLLNKTCEPSKNDKRANETRNLTEANMATSKKTYNKDMPFIKSKQGSFDTGLEFPEVQDAMKADDLMLQNRDAWLNDDLLCKVKNDDYLHRCLSDPAYVQAITEMQTNPQAATQRYQNNPEMQRFLQEFMTLMGDHFTTLGGTPKDAKSQNTDTPARLHHNSADVNVNRADKAANKPDDDRKMQDILADPEIMQILKDSRIQSLFEALRTKPALGQRMLQTADPDMRRKIQRLVDVGLLGLEML